MALIDFNADVRELTKQATRIANALDRLLIEAYGVHMTPPKADTSGSAPTVDYSTDEDMLRQEIVEQVKGKPPDDDDDGA